jgi:hypothetical protein
VGFILRIKITIIERWVGYKEGSISWQKLKQVIKETHEENYDDNLVIEKVKVERLKDCPLPPKPKGLGILEEFL